LHGSLGASFLRGSVLVLAAVILSAGTQTTPLEPERPKVRATLKSNSILYFALRHEHDDRGDELDFYLYCFATVKIMVYGLCLSEF